MEELHRRRMAWSLFITGKPLLLVLVVAATLSLEHSVPVRGGALATRSDCQRICGNITIPYPFGIGDGCFRAPSFNVSCLVDVKGQEAAYLGSAESFLEVLEIYLPLSQVVVKGPISSTCRNGTNDPTASFTLDFPFTLSNENKLTAIGCPLVATIEGESQYRFTSACGSVCNQDTMISNISECAGVGCCQTSIPSPGNLRSLKISLTVTADSMNKNISAPQMFTSSCSYAFFADLLYYGFKFDPWYVNSTKFGELDVPPSDNGVPLVLDWVIPNETCQVAKKNVSSYACLSANSECINSPNSRETGYFCQCSIGYEGNPYILEGCADIDECLFHPCNGTCINTMGGYYCTGRHQAIGMLVCSSLIVVCIFALLSVCQKRKLAKDKKRFFVENGGMILYQQILSRQVETVTIFTLEVLKTATNNFDKSMELGKGGQGTVYKGILSDKKVVAVKRSKVINMSQKEEFVQEIIILSQINHKNVVRLLGCCLEVEVPVLVYEFIPNGTLFHYLHGNHNRPPISLEVRLRIAQESAEALAYMHLSINHPIVHGDVKSLNILLDENNMAKVSDFGASRMLPKDVIQLMTMVQGTWGYLDPEYLQERKLTEKSDVYSFGVVLLELITRKKAIYSEGPEEEESLASSFLHAMRDNRVEGILDTSIVGEETVELLQEVAELGRQCLSVKGEDRPSMAQVADKLKTVRSSWRELLLLKHSKSDVLIERSSMTSDASPSQTSWSMDIETANAYHANSSNCTA